MCVCAVYCWAFCRPAAVGVRETFLTLLCLLALGLFGPGFFGVLHTARGTTASRVERVEGLWGLCPVPHMLPVCMLQRKRLALLVHHRDHGLWPDSPCKGVRMDPVACYPHARGGGGASALDPLACVCVSGPSLMLACGPARDSAHKKEVSVSSACCCLLVRAAGWCARLCGWLVRQGQAGLMRGVCVCVHCSPLWGLPSARGVCPCLGAPGAYSGYIPI